MESRQGPARLLGIDTLRGLSALYVVCFHVALLPPALQWPPSLTYLVMNGGSGVTMFYILSAFTLAYTWLKKIEPSFVQQYASYMKRRFLRIAPLYYVMLAIYPLFIYLQFGKIYSWQELTVNAFFLHSFFPGWHEGIVWASWSIGVEMLFYVLMPFLIYRRLTVLRSVVLFFIMLGVAIVFRYTWVTPTPEASSYQYNSLLNHLPVFMTGFLCYSVYTRLAPSRLGQSRIFSYALLIAGIALFHWIVTRPAQSFLDSPIPYVSRLEFQAVGLGLIALSVALHPASWLVNRVTVFLGKISFSLYLCHPMLVFFLRPIATRIEAALGPWGFVACFALTVVVLVPVAALTYHVIERPFITRGGTSWSPWSSLHRLWPARLAVGRAGAARTSPHVQPVQEAA